MSFEAYKVAVRMSLIDGVSSGLVGIVGHFHTLNNRIDATRRNVSDLERSLAKLGKMTLVGGAMAAAGGFGLSLFKGPIDEARKLQTEIAKFSALGLGEKTNKEAIEYARGMDLIGSSTRDTMKLLRESTSITGSFEHGVAITPILAKMKFGIQSVMGGEHGSNFDRMFQDAIKTTELRGALVDRETGHIDTNSFKRVLNMMTQAYVASGGMVKPQDYLAAIKTGGVSTKLMNDESFFFGLGHFMQESGGSRTGTASMSMFQNWAMGRAPQRVNERMADIGLLDRSKIHYGKTGHITGVDPMGMIRANEFVENPFKYVNEVIVPLLQKKGYKGNELNLQLASLLGIRTASNLADQFVREQKVADLYIQRSKKAAGIDGLAGAGENTLDGKLIIFEKRWQTLLGELGTTILPAAIKGVEMLSAAIKGAVKFAREFPTLTKAMAYGFGVLAGLCVAGGAIVLATAAFKALGLALTLGKAGSLAGGLSAAAVGLTAVAGAVSVLLGVGIGNYLGEKGDEAIQKSSGGRLSSLRDWLDQTSFGQKTGLFKFGQDEAVHFKHAGPKQGASGGGDVYLDSHKVGKVLDARQSKELSRPQTGGRAFDGSMSPSPVGAGAFGGK